MDSVGVLFFFPDERTQRFVRSTPIKAAIACRVLKAVVNMYGSPKTAKHV